MCARSKESDLAFFKSSLRSVTESSARRSRCFASGNKTDGGKPDPRAIMQVLFIHAKKTHAAFFKASVKRDVNCRSLATNLFCSSGRCPRGFFLVNNIIPNGTSKRDRANPGSNLV